MGAGGGEGGALLRRVAAGCGGLRRVAAGSAGGEGESPQGPRSGKNGFEGPKFDHLLSAGRRGGGWKGRQVWDLKDRLRLVAAYCGLLRLVAACCGRCGT